MVKLMPPRTLAISVDQLELLAAVFFTTALPAGNLTVLNLALQLMNAPTRIFRCLSARLRCPF
jgi:peptidoglycan biosynthesis protein MviN/MurJ (putative lipid II flippase)